MWLLKSDCAIFAAMCMPITLAWQPLKLTQKCFVDRGSLRTFIRWRSMPGLIAPLIEYTMMWVMQHFWPPQFSNALVAACSAMFTAASSYHSKRISRDGTPNSCRFECSEYLLKGIVVATLPSESIQSQRSCCESVHNGHSVKNSVNSSGSN